jgi:hypothetical protein
MTSERKEPHLTDLDHAGNQERIPTLSERAAPDLFDELQDTLPDSGDTALNRDLGAALGDEDDAGPRLDDYDFIEELTREDEPAPAAREEHSGSPESAPAISPEDIEALSDRVLDQIAPALREAVTAAVTELLAGRARDRD